MVSFFYRYRPYLGICFAYFAQLRVGATTDKVVWGGERGGGGEGKAQSQDSDVVQWSGDEDDIYFINNSQCLSLSFTFDRSLKCD